MEESVKYMNSGELLVMIRNYPISLDTNPSDDCNEKNPSTRKATISPFLLATFLINILSN